MRDGWVSTTWQSITELILIATQSGWHLASCCQGTVSIIRNKPPPKQCKSDPSTEKKKKTQTWWTFNRFLKKTENVFLKAPFRSVVPFASIASHQCRCSNLHSLGVITALWVVKFIALGVLKIYRTPPPPQKNTNNKRFCPSESYESTDLCLDELGSHVKVSWLLIVFFKLHKGREWWATFKQPTTHTPNHLGYEIRPKKGRLAVGSWSPERWVSQLVENR